MNIFILSTNPTEAAQMQCDKHVVKMVLESAQMLSTIAGGPYKPTHEKHPCTLWAGANRVNFQWLVTHALALCDEYTFRYGKVHKSWAVINEISRTFELTSLPVGCTEFVQCMPDKYKHKDPVIAYRRYYHSKDSFAEWNKSVKPPFWWMDQEYESFRSVNAG